MSNNSSAETEAPETTGGDGPLLDLTDAGVKKFIKQAKARGYVTMDELNKVLPSEEVSPDAIEDTLAMLSEMGVNVVEAEEDAEASEGGEVATRDENTAVIASDKPAAYDRTDDPVRMYLREMGSVELLSREGEIAIAKRIEAGREAMIAGLCESPLTFQAIIIWRDELNEGKVLLRDIIDLEATYSGPDFKPEGTEDETDGDGEEGGEAASGSQAGVSGGGRPAPAAGGEAKAEGEADGESDGDGDDDDEFEANISLSAMEAELKPKVLETFDSIADEYKKLRRLQDQLVEQPAGGRDAAERQRLEALEHGMAEMRSQSVQRESEYQESLVAIKKENEHLMRQKDEQLLQDVVWDYFGGQYAASSKDKCVRVRDARAGGGCRG